MHVCGGWESGAGTLTEGLRISIDCTAAAGEVPLVPLDQSLEIKNLEVEHELAVPSSVCCPQRVWKRM